MATITSTTTTDDIDGSTEDVQTYKLGVDGSWYEIDLGPKQFAKFEKVLGVLFEKGRKVKAGTNGAKSKARKPQVRRSRDEIAAVRQFAAANGIEVSARGRVSEDVWKQYEASK